MSTPNRKSYPSDVTNDERDLVVPYLTLMSEQAAQRKHSLRELFNKITLAWEMHEQGTSHSQIAKHLHVPRETVGRLWLKGVRERTAASGSVEATTGAAQTSSAVRPTSS